ncbi:MAG: hypothetical protein OXJ90_24925 [Spirochaetaceae bacterium]|nr:hypothetical protein [Spirochaetaceae bacterium]
MSENEQDRLVGAAYRRMQMQRRHVACLHDKLKEMGRAFAKIGNATTDQEKPRIRPGRRPGTAEVGGAPMGSVTVSPEGETLVIPDRDDFLRSLAEYHEAQAALADAEASWEAITT